MSSTVYDLEVEGLERRYSISRKLREQPREDDVLELGNGVFLAVLEVTGTSVLGWRMEPEVVPVEHLQGGDLITMLDPDLQFPEDYDFAGAEWQGVRQLPKPVAGRVQLALSDQGVLEPVTVQWAELGDLVIRLVRA